MSIRIIPLGAGQDVGKSCILVTLGDFTIMFDCGMHMGFADHRRFPDFSYITRESKTPQRPDPFTSKIDCLIVSHFHLDHCGALPFFTEICGYHGPIYMTHPTKAICPILLEDYRKIETSKRNDANFFTSKMIDQCMQRVTGVSVHELITVKEGLEIKPYYAGHVLGAAMFLVRDTKHGHSVLYTGDYNTTPDRHLGAAWVDFCRPDVIITESTYATTVRVSKRARENQLLRNILRSIQQDGKVLIPVFALGRAQELCILLETYWERMNLQVPIYFTPGLAEKANQYYKLFVQWTNEKIRKSLEEKKNMFDFRRVKQWNSTYVNAEGPAVLFANPGMLHQGTSLDVFKRWCHDPKNMIILPGYCVAGTVGWKVLQGAKKVRLSSFEELQVNLQVENLSFSAHVDSKGIIETIRGCGAKSVVLVHGEKRKMEVLSGEINRQLGLECFYPANGEVVMIEACKNVPLSISSQDVVKIMQQRSVNDGKATIRADIVQLSECDFQLVEVDSTQTKCHVLEYSNIFRYTSACCPFSYSDTPWRESRDERSDMQKVREALQHECGDEFDIIELGEDGEVDSGLQIIGIGGKVSVTKRACGEILVDWNAGAENVAGRIMDVLDIVLQ